MKLIVASAGILVGLFLSILAAAFLNNGNSYWIHVGAVGLSLIIPCLWWLIVRSRDRSAFRAYQAEKQRFEDNLPLISEEDREELIRLAPHEKPAPIKKHMQWPVALSVLLLGAVWIAFPLPLKSSPKIESGTSYSSQPTTTSETTTDSPTSSSTTPTPEPSPSETPITSSIEAPAETTVQSPTSRAPVVPPLQPRVPSAAPPPANEAPAPTSVPQNPGQEGESSVVPPPMPSKPDSAETGDDFPPANPSPPEPIVLPVPNLPGF